MLLAEPESFCAIVLVVIAEVPFLIQKASLLDRVSNPPRLVDFALEEMFRSQRVRNQFDLVGKAFMEFAQHSSVFLNDGSELAFFVIVAALTWVRDIKD